MIFSILTLAYKVNRQISAIILMALATIGTPLDAREAFHVSDYGAEPDDNSMDGAAIRDAVADAIAHGGPTKIVLKPGIYKVSATGSLIDGIPIENTNDLIFEGAGANSTTIIFSKATINGFHINNSADVIIRKLSVDYGKLPFTQGTVYNVDTNAGTFELDIDSGFPPLSDSHFSSATTRWGMTIRNLGSGASAYTKYGPHAIWANTNWTLLANGRWQIATTAEGKTAMSQQGMANEDRYVHFARAGYYAFKVVNSTRPLIHDVNIYASPSLAVYFQGNKENARAVAVRVKRKGNRLVSTNADGVHATSNPGKIIVNNCTFEGMGDDGVNIYAAAGRINQKTSSTVIKVTHSNNKLAAEAGNRLQVYNPSNGTIRGEAEIQSAVPTGQYFTTITLKAAISNMAVNDQVFNLSKCGKDSEVKSCVFNEHRGRSVIFKTTAGKIYNNTFNTVEGWAVNLIKNGQYEEGPIARNISIYNNEIHHIGNGVNSGINIEAKTDSGAVATGKHFENISITNNDFINPSRHAIKAIGVKNLGVTADNRIEVDNGRKSVNSASLHLRKIENVTVDALFVNDPNPETYAVISTDDQSEVTATNIDAGTIPILKEE